MRRHDRIDLCVRLRIGRGSSYSFGGFHSKQQAHYFPSPIETSQAKGKKEKMYAIQWNSVSRDQYTVKSEHIALFE